MNVGLDQDTMELLGVAYRDARGLEPDEPLPEKLRDLWEKLSDREGVDADRHPEARAEKRRAHA